MNTRIDFTDSVNLAKTGNMEAFQFLYNQSVRILKAEIMKITSNAQDIEDILQEAYCKIFQKLDSLQDPKAYMGWAQKIARNEAINFCQKNSRISEQESSRPLVSEDDQEGLDTIAVDLSSVEHNPEAYIDAETTKTLLMEILDGLPSMQRACIVLQMEQLSTKEIAKELNIPEGTVKSNLNYARKKIKAECQELEKKGTKLYGLAPIPFFFWLLRLYDSSYLAPTPSKGSIASFEKIIQRAPEVAGSVPEVSVETVSMKQASKTVPETVSNTSVSDMPMNETLSSASAPASNGATSAVQTVGKTAAATAKGIAGKSIATKIIAAVVAIGVVGGGIYGGYQLAHKDTKTEAKSYEELIDKNSDIKDAVTVPDAEDVPDEDSISDTNLASDKDNTSISIESSSEELAEILGLEYIGNDSLSSENELRLPFGFIAATAEDFDNDSELEILAVFLDGIHSEIIISLYEQNNEEWGSSANINYAVTTAEDDAYIPIPFRFLVLKTTDGLLVYNNSDCFTYHYKDGEWNSAPYIVDHPDTSATPIASFVYAYANSDTIVEMSQSAWNHEPTSCYMYTAVDCTELSTYVCDEFTFQYPKYYDSVLSFQSVKYYEGSSPSFSVIARLDGMTNYIHSQDTPVFSVDIYQKTDIAYDSGYWQNPDGWLYTDGDQELIWVGQNTDIICGTSGDKTWEMIQGADYSNNFGAFVRGQTVLYSCHDIIKYTFEYTGMDTPVEYPTLP